MKYKLTNKKIDYLGRTLYQIEAVKKFGNIAKGQKGGFIEKKSNLSQDGNAWVYNYAMVYGDAKVCDNAKVYDCAKVRGVSYIYVQENILLLLVPFIGAVHFIIGKLNKSQNSILLI